MNRGLRLTSAGALVGAIAGLATALAASRLYGVTAVGLQAIASAPYLVLQLFSSTGEQAAFQREAAGLERKDPWLTGLFTGLVLYSTLLTLVCSVAIVPIVVLALGGDARQAPGFFVSLGLALIGYIGFDNLSWNIDSLFAAVGAVQELALAKLIRPISTFILVVIGAVVRPTAVTLIAASVAGSGLATLYRLTQIPSVLDLQSRTSARAGLVRVRSVVRYGLRLFPMSAGQALVQQLPVILLGRFADEATVGQFARAIGLFSRLEELLFRLTEVLLPQLVSSVRQKRVPRRLVTQLRQLVVGAVAVSMGSAIGAPVILRVFGMDFVPAANVFRIASVSFVALTIASIANMDALSNLTADQQPTWEAVMFLGFGGVMVPAVIYGGPEGAAGVLCAMQLGRIVVWHRRLRRSGSTVPSLHGFKSVTRRVGAVALVAILSSWSATRHGSEAWLGFIGCCMVALLLLLRTGGIRLLGPGFSRRSIAPMRY